MGYFLDRNYSKPYTHCQKVGPGRGVSDRVGPGRGVPDRAGPGRVCQTGFCRGGGLQDRVESGRGCPVTGVSGVMD